MLSENRKPALEGPLLSLWLEALIQCKEDVAELGSEPAVEDRGAQLEAKVRSERNKGEEKIAARLILVQAAPGHKEVELHPRIQASRFECRMVSAIRLYPYDGSRFITVRSSTEFIHVLLTSGSHKASWLLPMVTS